MDKFMVKRYSEAFKKQVVQEYQEGHSIESLRRRYDIGGKTTVQRWIRQYGSAGFRHEVIVMQRPEEREQAQQREQELEARIAELEQAVAQLALDKLMLETTLEVASEVVGEDLKKKFAPRSSSASARKKKQQGQS